jgi:putative effector of murein hydrolase
MTVVLLVMLLLSSPLQALLGLAIVALAIPVYRFVQPAPGMSRVKEMIP